MPSHKQKRPNERLRRQRELRGWSQQKVADLIHAMSVEERQPCGITGNLVGNWELGKNTPSPFYREKLCRLYRLTADELGLIEADQPDVLSEPIPEQRDILPSLPASPEDIIGEVGEREEQEMDKLRRSIVQFGLEVAGIPLFSLARQVAGHYQSSSSRTIEAFLALATNAVQTAWDLMEGKELAEAEEILSACLPPLIDLALEPSHYQQTAANIATRGCMLRAILAKHRLNYIAREMYCYQAIQCSRLSNDCTLQSVAQIYLAYTYLMTQPAQPSKSIQAFTEVLQTLGNEDAVIKSDIYIGMAEAFSLLKDERQAQKAIDAARNFYPGHPESNPGYVYLDCPISIVYQWQAKVYLNLGYYQRALDVLEQCTKMYSSLRGKSEIFIHRAEAALGLGNREFYLANLKEGAQLALVVGSQHRYREALAVYQKKPESWRNDRPIKELAQLFASLPQN